MDGVEGKMTIRHMFLQPSCMEKGLARFAIKYSGAFMLR
jgi:hypothetical protein